MSNFLAEYDRSHLYLEVNSIYHSEFTSNPTVFLLYYSLLHVRVRVKIVYITIFSKQNPYYL